MPNLEGEEQGFWEVVLYIEDFEDFIVRVLIYRN